MNIKTQNRVLEMANIILEKKATVRQVASIVGYSKSTVHKDLTDKLRIINFSLYNEVKEILDYNKQVRHIRGGQSTKQKFSNHI